MGLPQICKLASPPNPNTLFFSLALTKSEISSRAPEAGIVAPLTVTSTEPEPSSGKVLPANCAATILLSSTNGRSIGTAISSLPGPAGTIGSGGGKGANRFGVGGGGRG